MRWWCGSSTVFARSTSHLLRALETFRDLGVEFVSLTEAVDTTTAAGKMVFVVLAAVAELERSLIVERVKAGLRNARAKGRRLGRPRVSVSATKIQELRAGRSDAARDRQALPYLENQRDQSTELAIAALSVSFHVCDCALGGLRRVLQERAPLVAGARAGKSRSDARPQAQSREGP